MFDLTGFRDLKKVEKHCYTYSSLSIKHAKMLDVRTELQASTSTVNFINIKCTNFTYESLFSSYVLALNELSYKKYACKTLMKLTSSLVIGQTTSH